MNDSPLEMTFLASDRLRLELPQVGNLPDTVHLFETKDIDAVNAALASRRPLLVRGEPGTGKSQLARAAAQGLGRAFVWTVIDARTEARDLQWTFDAVRRLADAQLIGAGLAPEGEQGISEGASVARLLDERRYVTPGPLWWAFDWRGAEDHLREGEEGPEITEGCFSENGVVLLLDEIDKADTSVPNGLLECLGHGRFRGPGGAPVECRGTAPLVVVTTNEERALPDAFLRRCLVRHLSVPAEEKDLIDWLERRGRAHFAKDVLADSVLAEAARMLARDRAAVKQRGLCPPGGAEYLDLLRAVSELAKSTAEQEAHLARIREFVLRKHPQEDAW